MKSTYQKRWGHERKPHHGNKTRREQKRLEAEERQKYYDSLSRAEKLQLIHFRRGQSSRELERVLAGA
jgi:hypothetical protein